MSPLGQWAGIGALAIGVVTVATWNLGSTSAPPEPRAELTADGAQLFRAKGCASCHDGPDSRALFAAEFPSLEDAPAWAGERRPGLSAAEYLAESIAAPAVFVSPEFRPGQAGPTDAMPTLSVTGDEIAALVDYLLQR